MTTWTNFQGKFLIATPSLGDPRFERTVIYLCAHDAEHAMGLVINKRKGELSLSNMLERIGIEGEVSVADSPVLNGGPVDIDRGFVLHSPDYFKQDTSLRLSDTLMLTTTKDILEALVSNKAPERAVLAIGYAGWTSGQLEREIAANAWIICDSDDTLIFDTDMDDKWVKALNIMGISPEMLSGAGGTA